MYEKVNPSHPDKLADRIAGALVDKAYEIEEQPKIAVEILLGHGICHIITETSVNLKKEDIENIVWRICKDNSIKVIYEEYHQDVHLADNQKDKIRCGDNGIFKGVPVTQEQSTLTKIARSIYDGFPSDGKYVLDGKKLVVCQSNATDNEFFEKYPELKEFDIVLNPLGYWTGGINTDTGAVNRKLGSDMGDCVTGGGINGKDISKADVSLNIYAFLKAQELGTEVWISCAIGDEYVDGKPYSEIVDIAHRYILSLGGFEKFAEWGLIR